jgi:hypothetical protein
MKELKVGLNGCRNIGSWLKRIYWATTISIALMPAAVTGDRILHSDAQRSANGYLAAQLQEFRLELLLLVLGIGSSTRSTLRILDAREPMDEKLLEK